LFAANLPVICAFADLRALALVAALAGQASAPPPPLPSRSEAERTVARHLTAGRVAEALATQESLAARYPDDPQVLFDAARVASLAGDARQSASFAMSALRAGWLDDEALASHADLARARAHEAWAQVMRVQREIRAETPRVPPPTRAGSPDALVNDARARSSLREWLERFGGGRYRVRSEPALNLLIASSIDTESLDRTIVMLSQLSEALTRSLFERAQDDAVLLVIAPLKDADEFFKNLEHAGLYEHAPRRLVTRDTGASLRHEYTHVLHHGHMARVGQRHPLWIQEALATLFEHWEWGPNRELVVLPNLRSNEAYELVRRHRAVPLAEFVTLSDSEFLAKPIDHYAQARSVLLFVAEQGRLQSFYKAVVAGFATDPTGRRALESALDAPIGRIEADWQAWVRARGPIDASVNTGDGVLGVSLSPLPDGVRIDEVQEGGPAMRAGLRKGDAITQIDGVDIRGVGDFLLIAAKKNPGESLAVRFRRGGSYGTVTVRLASSRASPP
jgi:hypothetical protein